MKLFLFFLSCFFSIGLSAQEHALLIGQIRHPVQKYITVKVDKTYLENRIIEEALGINSSNKFGMLCPISVAQLVEIQYNGHKCMLFLAPGDTLELDIDGNHFPESIKFNGRGAAANRALVQFAKAFPKKENFFEYRQYRKGDYYYQVHESLDQTMRDLAPADFVDSLRRKEAAQAAFLQEYFPENHSASDFRQYLAGEIEWNSRYQQLAYGAIYQGRHGLDSSYFYFVDSLAVFNDKALGHPDYRAFLTAYLHYQSQRYSAQTDGFEQRYYLANQRLSGLSKYWMMAEVLRRAFSKVPADTLMPIYEHFLENNPYYEFDQVVVDAYHQTRQFAAGTPAPGFALYDFKGTSHSLSDYRGKVVYLDFWASWCKPCMKKMKDLQEIEYALAHKNIRFIHVNLDKSPEIWKKTIESHKFAGLQLYIGNNDKIINDYELLAVPKFFIISPEGNFAQSPGSSDLDLLLEQLLKLTN